MEATSPTFQEKSGTLIKKLKVAQYAIKKDGASQQRFGLGWVWQHRGGAGSGPTNSFALGIFKPEGTSQPEETKQWDGGSLGRACPNDGGFALPLNELQNCTTAKLLSATMSKALSSCTGFKGVQPLTCQGKKQRDSFFCWNKSRLAACSQLAAKATNNTACAAPASDSSHRPRELWDYFLFSHPLLARSTHWMIRPGRNRLHWSLNHFRGKAAVSRWCGWGLLRKILFPHCYINQPL